MSLYLRKASIEDRELLFKWANDPTVRANSFSTEKISYDEHVLWFDNIMKRSDCIQYILMDNDMPIGQARVSIEGEIAEIGYSICKEKRGMGYGSELLKFVSREIYKNCSNISKIIGRVKPENIASQKAFIKAGYIEKYRTFEIKRKY